MKNIPSPEPDDRLSRVLQHWKVTAELPPRFQEQVWQRIWQRIAHAEGAPKSHLWSKFLNWLGTALPRPAMAVSYFVVLLAAGVAGGYWRGQEKAAHIRDHLGSRYVQSVDPYQALLARK